MEARDLTVPATDGYPLAATLYRPTGSGSVSSTGDSAEASPAAASPRVVLLTSAMAVPRGYYDAFARHLAGRGFTALTFDYRGTGGSAPSRLRGFDATLSDWGEKDVPGVLRWIDAELAPGWLALCGHSVGGQLIGLLPEPQRLDALLTVAAQSGYWGHWSGLSKLGVWLLWHLLIPVSCRLLGYFPARRLGMGPEGLPAGVAREWARWGRHRDYLMAERFGERSFGAFRAPVLGLSLSDDGYAPRPAVEALLSWLTQAEVEHRHLRPADFGLERIGHFGFFRPHLEESLWPLAAGWLAEQAGQGGDTGGPRLLPGATGGSPEIPGADLSGIGREDAKWTVFPALHDSKVAFVEGENVPSFQLSGEDDQ